MSCQKIREWATRWKGSSRCLWLDGCRTMQSFKIFKPEAIGCKGLLFDFIVKKAHSLLFATSLNAPSCLTLCLVYPLWILLFDHSHVQFCKWCVLCLGHILLNYWNRGLYIFKISNSLIMVNSPTSLVVFICFKVSFSERCRSKSPICNYEFVCFPFSFYKILPLFTLRVHA